MFKNLGKVGQWTGEKFGSFEATQLEEEFAELDKKIEVYDHLGKNICKITEELLQPNSANRGRMKLLLSGKTEKKYNQPESDLSDVMKHASDVMIDTSYGQSLILVGDGEEKIAEARHEMDRAIMTSLVRSLSNMQHSDIKSVKSYRRKLESQRLEFDSKKRAHMKKKSDEKLEAEFKIAQARFGETKELTIDLMNDINNDDLHRCTKLKSAIQSQYDFHLKAAEILETEVLEKLYANLAEAVSRRKRADYRTKKETEEAGYRKIYVDVLFDFEAENDTEMTISKGDRIEILTELDDNWLEGTINGKSGLFPVSYVEYCNY